MNIRNKQYNEGNSLRNSANGGKSLMVYIKQIPSKILEKGESEDRGPSAFRRVPLPGRRLG